WVVLRPVALWSRSPFVVLLRDHSRLAGIVEQSPSIHNRPHVAKGLKLVGLSRVLHCYRAGVKIDRDLIARFQNLAQSVTALAGIQFPGRHTIAEKNTRKAFGQH